MTDEESLAAMNAHLAEVRVNARRMAVKLRELAELAEMPDTIHRVHDAIHRVHEPAASRPLDNDPVTAGERNRVMAVDLARRAVDTVKAADLLTYSDDELLAEIGRRGAARKPRNLLGSCPCPICDRRRAQLGIPLDPEDGATIRGPVIPDA